MKFTANSLELQRALQRVSGVIPARSTMPILECILFDLQGNTLTLTGTDIEISLTVSVQVKGGANGRIAIPAKRLTDTVRAMADTPLNVEIDLGSKKVSISTVTGRYSLTGEDAKEFPGMEVFKSEKNIQLEAAAVQHIIHSTAFAVSTDELRPAMMGVLLQAKAKDLCAVATDGHRLVRLRRKMSAAMDLDRDIIVPAKALNLLAKSLESEGSITFSISDTHIRFAYENTLLVSKLIAERYPNYESVIPPDNDKTMSVARNTLMGGIKRVALYASATTHQVRFSLGSGGLTISAQDMDFGGEAKETIACEYDGTALEIGFNANYLIDILSHLDGEQSVFRFSSPTRAGIVERADARDGEEVLMLVMPVRLNT